MKNLSGFIQILLLIAIVAGILVVASIGYFEFTKYTRYQTSTVATSTPMATSSNSVLQQQVNELQNEVNTLKAKTTKPATAVVPSATSQSSVNTAPKNDDLPQSLLDEVLQRTVKVTCQSSTQIRQGSGLIGVTSEDSNLWYVFTNAHVVLAGTPDDNTCTIGVPSTPDYSITKNFQGKIVDVSHQFPTIDKAVLSVTGDRGFKNAKDVMPLCNFNGVQIGDKITIAGYPAYGGSSLTVTEGIVSGFEETQYGRIYKTSAKIDSGNSGGTAVDDTKRCWLGMPTWATQGTFEGLGYVQSWEMIVNSINSGNL